MCERQPHDGRGLENGGVKPPLEPKSDEINQSAMAMGAEAQRTRVATTVADKMVW